MGLRIAQVLFPPASLPSGHLISPGTSRQSCGLFEELNSRTHVRVHGNPFSRTQDPKGLIPALPSNELWKELRPLHFLKVHTQVSPLPSNLVNQAGLLVTWLEKLVKLLGPGQRILYL